jgi:putative permease
MYRILRGLAYKYFSDEEAVILFLILVTGTVFIIWFGAMLAQRSGGRGAPNHR